VRRRLSILVAATTSAVVIAFLVPLALLLRTLAEDRSIAAGYADAQAPLTLAIGRPSPADAEKLVGPQLADQGNRLTRTTLYLPNGHAVGPDKSDPFVDVVLQRRSAVQRVQDDGSVVVYAFAETSNGQYVARTLIPEDVLHHGVMAATGIIAGLGALLLAAALFAADLLARRVSKPLLRVARAADSMREGDLQTRVPESGPPEVITLARALNLLADRVGRLLASERDAVADLSHRLRTPVTALRLDTEMITDPEVSDRIRGHITQLERTVDAIVHDARRPTRSDAAGSCDAAKVVRDRVAFWSALAEEQERPLRTAVPEDRALPARVNASDLADVVDVLLDNVFAHTDDGVPIEVWVVPRADGAVVLTVEDGGTGLPAGDIVTRGKSGAGSSGLGLDIARRTALASGGWLELGQSRLGGALVRVVLGGT
jgi:signal transduction histidine kinase